MDLIRVIEIEPRGELKLKIAFSDGLSGVLDFSHFLTGGIFLSLREPSLFTTASVQYGTIVWQGDVDMAPEYLHTKMLKQGTNLHRPPTMSHH